MLTNIDLEQMAEELHIHLHERPTTYQENSWQFHHQFAEIQPKWKPLGGLDGKG